MIGHIFFEGYKRGHGNWSKRAIKRLVVNHLENRGPLLWRVQTRRNDLQTAVVHCISAEIESFYLCNNVTIHCTL